MVKNKTNGAKRSHIGTFNVAYMLPTPSVKLAEIYLTNLFSMKQLAI